MKKHNILIFIYKLKMSQNIDVTSIDSFYGINVINKLNICGQMIIVIDNKTLYNDYFLVKNIVKLVEYTNTKYNEIKIISSFPKINCKFIELQNMYASMNNIIRAPINNKNDHFGELLDFVLMECDKIELTYENTNIPRASSAICCVIISNAYNYELSKQVEDKLIYLSNKTHLCYYDFNIKNEEGIANIQSLDYYNNRDNKSEINFMKFINNYNFDKTENKEIMIELNNGIFLNNLTNKMNVKYKCYGMIQKIIVREPLIIKIDDITITEEQNMRKCNDEYKYIEQILYGGDKSWSNNMHIDDKMKIDYLEKFEKIIKEKINIFKKNGNNEEIQKRTWLKNQISNIITKNLKEFVDNADENIKKLALNSVNKTKYSRLNNKFNMRVIQNANMLKESKTIYGLDQRIENFLNSEKTDKFDASCEIYYSVISMSNWYEELENGSSMGLMIKIKSNDMAKFCVTGSNISIEEITLSCISIKDYIDSVVYQFDQEYNVGDVRYGNLNNMEIIKGNGIGSSNAVIPLYINENHWYQTKKQIPYLFGIMLAHNPLGYTDNHLNFMFNILIEMTRKTYIKNDNYSVMWIKIYFGLLRTVSEIAYERGYNKGIKKILKEYMTDQEKRLTKEYNIEGILGQIICTGTIIEEREMDTLMDCILENYIRKHVTESYDKNYLKYLITKKNNNDYEDEIERLIKFVDEHNIYIYELMIGFKKMYKILRIIVNEIGGFKKFLNRIDENYGTLPDVICELAMKNIVKNPENISYTDLYDDNEKSKKKILFYTLRSIEYSKLRDIKKAIIENKLNNFNEEDSILKIISEYENKYR